MTDVVYHIEVDTGYRREDRRFFLVLVLVFVLLGLWAHWGVLDIISLAEGEVSPSGKVKKVQHLEGGIVRSIHVREGDAVGQGEELVTLEPTARDSDVQELQARQVSLQAEEQRLAAEVAGTQHLEFDAQFRRLHPDLVAQTLGLFQNRRRHQENLLSEQRELVSQRTQDIAETQARIANQEKRLALIREQVSISTSLLKRDITNRYGHLDLLKEANALEGKLEEDKVALSRAQSALKEAQMRLVGRQSAFVAESETQLEAVRRELQEIAARSGKFRDNLDRTVIRAPVEGVVKTLHVFTIGGVIKPGDVVLELVPKGDRLVIESKLSTRDIGHVQPGQLAEIRLIGADAARYGKIEGVVAAISPDTLVTEKGLPFYKVRVETEKTFFSHGDNRYLLYPGMIVQILIHTGQRTVLEYLLSPFISSAQLAMKEL
ncbi:MAG: HlyD family type I secretion periplasmic adaptor subunit [Magnetococcales bacterium]|nr:HlyD family type I secretion periplasmic adaptor subunit [Magnetococcales bacterium]MBF0148571.1 HlyD family type I secretion periplasmic adaptor subunit [Magnetococcales bacterium]MBF0629736.1 HlyD family type I secretion periplasmic adaptor subunit [Magnetococcales bacterium]